MSDDRTPAEIAASKRIKAEARAARLAGVLTHLHNEVRGMMELIEPWLREQIGNTNYACVMQRLDEARTALASSGGTLGEAVEGERSDG